MERKNDQSPKVSPMQRWNVSRIGRATWRIPGRTNSSGALVVEDGSIVDRGTHEELLAAGGRYEELHRTQLAV